MFLFIQHESEGIGMTAASNMRPESLQEMIGQEAIKQKAGIAMRAALQRGEPLPHCLLTSPGGGLGKTTFASILANEMYSPLLTTTGQCINTPVDLRNTLVRIKPGTLVLVDEFHGIGNLAAEELLLVLEESVINVTCRRGGSPVRLAIPPFTLLAATTKPSAISAPLRQRFGLQFRFAFYSVEDLKTIVKNMAARMGLSCDDPVCKGIARRAQGIPRIALRLLERVRDVVQARQLSMASEDELMVAMRIEGIDDLGLRSEDRHLLRVLAEVDPRPISARNLALALGVGVTTIMDVIEPTLIRMSLMTIGSGGRRITEKGMDHLRIVERKEVA